MKLALHWTLLFSLIILMLILAVFCAVKGHYIWLITVFVLFAIIGDAYARFIETIPET